MRSTPGPGKTFSPGKSELFWCDRCSLPLIGSECSTCGQAGRRMELAPPGDIRLCSQRARGLLADLFLESFGYAGFLQDRIILLNKIAGLDRRDQVIIEGRHIATLWFDVAAGGHRLDIEPAGASLLTEKAKKGLVVCDGAILKGHIKGKWLPPQAIISILGDAVAVGIVSDRADVSQPESKASLSPAQGQSTQADFSTSLACLAEGDNLVLKIGKFAGVGVVRRRGDGSKAIRIRDMTQASFSLSDSHPGLTEVLAANRTALQALEKAALSEIKGYLSRNRLPVNVSFSGGKDSLACLILARKALSRPEVLFINTGLEFPETVAYVRDLIKSIKLPLHEIRGESNFFDQVQVFGPPAKDYRWCCKTNKLGPMTSFLAEHYPRGCVTVDGRRIYESFNRSAIRAVERNPYVPSQTTIAPIRNWRALEVMLYIHESGLPLNPLYEQDYERIGCWLCPACLQSEFANLKDTHPQLFGQWTASLQDWAAGKGLESRYIDWGFWRWKSHPPKMLELADGHGISLHSSRSGAGGDGRREGSTEGGKGKGEEGEAGYREDEVSIQAVRGRSPCGLEYTIEAKLTFPQNHPFSSVAQALKVLGEVQYAEDLGAAVVRTEKGRATVFAGGHIMIIAGREEAEVILRDVCEAVLRAQLCMGCGICEKNCPRGAITLSGTIEIDGKKCNQCKKCIRGCIAADRAGKITARIFREENGKMARLSGEQPLSEGKVSSRFK